MALKSESEIKQVLIRMNFAEKYERLSKKYSVEKVKEDAQRKNAPIMAALFFTFQLLNSPACKGTK